MKFDNDFKKLLMTENLKGLLKWLPWVGKNYKLENHFKLLIIGESHYEWCPYTDKDKIESPENIKEQLNDPQFTRTFISEQGLYFDEMHKKRYPNDNNRKFLNGVENILFGEKNINLWHNVAYYNFLQKPLLSCKSEDRPVTKDWNCEWKKGWDIFLKVCEILHPTHCLFCGVGIADSINPNEFEVKLDGKIGRVKRRIIRPLLLAHKDKSFVFIQHPSKVTPKYFGKWGKFIGEQNGWSSYYEWLSLKLIT